MSDGETERKTNVQTDRLTSNDAMIPLQGMCRSSNEVNNLIKASLLNTRIHNILMPDFLLDPCGDAA